jgi:hypothetical protein
MDKFYHSSGMEVGRFFQDDLQEIFKLPPFPNICLRNNEYKLTIANLVPYVHFGACHGDRHNV